MPARSVPARALAVAGAVAVLVAGLAACNDASDDQDPDRRSFSLPGRTLTIDSDDSALEIVAADGHRAGAVEVTRWFKGSVAVGSKPEVTWRMEGDRLTLRMHCSGIVADCSARHLIRVPRGVAVTVRDGDGSVRARGFEEPLTIRSGDGSVHVTDSSGPLELRTGDGHARAEVSSRRVIARTGDGSLRLQLSAVPDLVEARSGDGSISLTLPRSAYRVTTRTGDGSAKVSVPRDDDSAHVVNARTGDGSITVDAAG
ncbi:DUF4097 family beta strand repeat-containing protein [Streptomyces sp. SID8352]|uniref:DUF4097 family beta strand repeat-containing protein n=1 Tax=Streptomyces sp. SID8352 TaxID=2690338 RepID=UPI00136DBE2F|nr:DUF4097 family beta strand repeat-containing protein [Streptomyces sp. SID8352]MYU21333.1 DUF4097 family beta strand repeat protein [Streptomyces sp. SID8352]